MSDKLNKINEKFRNERSSVSIEIQESIELMGNLRTIKECQVKMLSLRQRLLESNHTLLEHLSIIRKKFRTERQQHMEKISTQLNHRYQSTEKNTLIDGLTAPTRESLDLIENQISFFNDSIKTVDNVLYGIKTRVEIEKVIGI